MTSFEQHTPQHDYNLLSSTEDAAKQTVAFSLLYHAADVQWIGGALTGNWVSDKYGINPWVAAVSVAATVGFIEYKLSNIAVRTFEKKEDIEKSTGPVKRAFQELGGAAYAAFAGSANGVKINDSLGLESTSRRRKAQAAIFGTAVGIWVTPLPLYEDASDIAMNTVQDMIDDPKTFALYSAISIGGILGISKVFKESRKAYNRFKESRTPSLS